MPPSNTTVSVAAILAEASTRYGKNTALVMGQQRISYAQLWDETRAYAGALRARGIGPGDSVAVLLPNVPDFARTYYAILALGATVPPWCRCTRCSRPEKFSTSCVMRVQSCCSLAHRCLARRYRPPMLPVWNC